MKTVIKSILQKKLSKFVHENIKCTNIYIKYIFYKTCFTLKQIENQNQKSEEVVFQI